MRVKNKIMNKGIVLARVVQNISIGRARFQVVLSTRYHMLETEKNAVFYTS